MDASANTPAARLSTRLAFLIAGFGTGCWSPLIPYAQAHLAAGEAEMGMLLLCLGVGSVIAMPIAGLLALRLGSRPLILSSAIVMALALPVLAFPVGPVLLAAGLFAFGASLGSLDVAMNVHAVQVESASGRPLMSGFHGLYSAGGFAGAGGLTALLTAGFTPLASAAFGALLMLGAAGVAAPRLLRTRQAGDSPAFALPRGIVLLIALLTAAVFLTEGAMLDWSALLITEAKRVTVSQGGLGYMLFSIAMTLGRFSGDWTITRVGDRNVLVWGALITAAGIAVLLAAPLAAVAMTGFLLIGFGAANLVPVFFSLAGRQTLMPAGLAIAAITTAGYAGILAGPAAIGFLADWIGLKSAFWLLAGLMLLIPAFAKKVTPAAR